MATRLLPVLVVARCGLVVFSFTFPHMGATVVPGIVCYGIGVSCYEPSEHESFADLTNRSQIVITYHQVIRNIYRSKNRCWLFQLVLSHFGFCWRENYFQFTFGFKNRLSRKLKWNKNKQKTVVPHKINNKTDKSSNSKKKN